MRMTQVFGLTEEARKFIEEYRLWADTRCPHCNKIIDREMIPSKVIGSLAHEGMFNDGPEIVEYKLKNGLTAREEHQATVCSSGPCIFTRLIVSDGRVFEWSKKEIENA